MSSPNQIKKKYLAPEVIEYFDNQIDSVESQISQEILDRQSGDSALSSQIALKANQSALDQEISDRQSGDASTLASANAYTDSKDVSQKSYIDSQDAAKLLEAKSYADSLDDVKFYDNLASFPGTGSDGVIYLAKDSDKLYRWKTVVVPGSYDHIVGPTGSFATLQEALASPSVTNGQSIQIQAGTYLVSSTIEINKSVKIFGASKESVIFETAGGASDPVSMFNVSVNDVCMANMTIKHKKTTNTSIETAVVVSGPGFPQTRVFGFIMDGCLIEHVEFAVTIRGGVWKIANTDFSYMGPSNSTRRHVGVYGVWGDCYGVNNRSFDNGATGNLRWWAITSTTGTNPNETLQGALILDGNIQQSGALHQFVSQDAWQGNAYQYDLLLKNNVVSESNAFVSFFGATPNFGNVINQVLAYDNTLTNLHGGTPPGGKGIFGIDGSGGVPFRSDFLTAHIRNNVLSNMSFRSDYTEAPGSEEFAVGYSSNVTFPSNVNQYANSGPTINPPPATPALGPVSSAEYVEVSKSDLAALEAEVDALQTGLAQEILDRQSGDSALSGQLALKASQSALDQEILDRQSGDSSLSSQIALKANQSALDQEVLDRQSGDAANLARIEALENFSIAQTIYVAKSGNDTTGTGGQHKPFLTLTKAFSMITDASPSKRYVIRVAAGNYTEAALELPSNVFVIGEQKETVRITGPVSMGAWTQDNSGSDDRSGFSMVSLLSAANFNWSTAKSRAGKLYLNEVVFGSTVQMYGYDNAIAQAQFDSCVIFGALTVSGINVGVFSNNICFNDINLNQHPNGGMATILAASGGQCNGTVRQTTAVSDFNRRCATFLRSFPCENLIVDGPSSYADFTLESGSKNGAQALNGGNLVPMNPIVSQRIVPNATNTHNLGDWGKQWMYNFAYVHASSGSDLYLSSVDSNYDPAGSSAGYSVNIESDGYGLKPNVNGGDINLKTGAVSGTGVRGKIKLDAREIDASNLKIKNLGDGIDPKDAVNKSQLDATYTALEDAILSQKDYIDNQDALKVSKSGDTMTSHLNISAGSEDIIQLNAATRTVSVQNQALMTYGIIQPGKLVSSKLLPSGEEYEGITSVEPGFISMQRPEGVPAMPTSLDHVTTKKYVDDQDSAKLLEAKTYADTKDAEKLLEAKSYADAAVLVEKNRAQGIESGLQSQINTEKGRIDAILDAAQADKDTFVEIVNLINSVDLENDNALASVILAEQNARESADNALDARIDALEAGGLVFHKDAVKTLGAGDLSYVDLEFEAKDKSINAYIGRLAIHEGVDYTLSVVGGKTRLTWIGSLVNPGGDEAVEVGDKFYANYVKK